MFDRIDVDGYAYDYRADDRLPLITYGFDTSDPASYTLTQIRLRPQAAENTFDNLEVDLAWDISDNFTLKGGVSSKEYDFMTTELRRSNGTTANLEANVAAQASTPLSQYSRLISIADPWDTPSGSVQTWLIPDVRQADALFNFGSFPLGPEPSLGNNRSVIEKNEGVFVQLDFNAMLGSVGMRGNVGARYVKTDQTSTGYQLAAGAPVPTTVVRDYDEVLPSLNFVFDLTEDLLVRFGVAEVITRPGLGNLTPGGTVSVSGNNRTVTSGNPYLDPFRADTIDVGIEWYFTAESLLGLALFQRDISTFPQSVSVTQPFTGNALGLPDSVAIAACGTVAGCTPPPTGCSHSRSTATAAISTASKSPISRRSRTAWACCSTTRTSNRRSATSIRRRRAVSRRETCWACRPTRTTRPCTTKPSASACAARPRIAAII